MRAREGKSVSVRGALAACAALIEERDLLRKFTGKTVYTHIPRATCKRGLKAESNSNVCSGVPERHGHRRDFAQSNWRVCVFACFVCEVRSRSKQKARTRTCVNSRRSDFPLSKY